MSCKALGVCSGIAICGWIKEQSSALFSLQLKCDDASGSYAQYNGNIGQQLWTTNGQSHSYNYTYDKANRLLSGISDENYNETVSYEELGNKNPSDIGGGNNLLDLSDLNKPEKQKYSSQVNGSSDERNTAGRMAAMKADSKSDPGRAIIHETLHLPGPSDRYTQIHIQMGKEYPPH